MKIEERFYAKAVADGDCWTWQASLDRDGYGWFAARNSQGGRGNVHAHRWSYRFMVGEIPPGLQLDHLCRNRACVNPYHLEVVTPRENNRRGGSPSALNAVKSRCRDGHPFDDANTYLKPDNGGRDCRACRDAARARYRARGGA